MHRLFYFGNREDVKKEFDRYVKMVTNNRERRLEIFNQVKGELEVLEKQCLETEETYKDLYPPQVTDAASYLLSPTRNSISTNKPSTGLSIGLFSTWKSIILTTLLGIVFIIFNICILLYTSHLRFPIKTLRHLPS